MAKMIDNQMLAKELLFLKMVPEAGVEPARCCPLGILSPVRLPIPPLGPVGV